MSSETHIIGFADLRDYRTTKPTDEMDLWLGEQLEDEEWGVRDDQYNFNVTMPLRNVSEFFKQIADYLEGHFLVATDANCLKDIMTKVELKDGEVKVLLYCPVRSYTLEEFMAKPDGGYSERL